MAIMKTVNPLTQASADVSSAIGVYHLAKSAGKLAFTNFRATLATAATSLPLPWLKAVAFAGLGILTLWDLKGTYMSAAIGSPGSLGPNGGKNARALAEMPLSYRLGYFAGSIGEKLDTAHFEKAYALGIADANPLIGLPLLLESVTPQLATIGRDLAELSSNPTRSLKKPLYLQQFEAAKAAPIELKRQVSVLSAHMRTVDSNAALNIKRTASRLAKSKLSKKAKEALLKDVKALADNLTDYQKLSTTLVTENTTAIKDMESKYSEAFSRAEKHAEQAANIQSSYRTERVNVARSLRRK